MVIFNFFRRKRPALTKDQERKLATIPNPQQRQALLTAIAKDEEIPDYAWHPIPKDFDTVSPAMRRALERLHKRAKEEGHDVSEISGNNPQGATVAKRKVARLPYGRII